MISRPRGAEAIPADSCPRCWSANRAKYATRATSCPGAKMPNTPHSSRGPSRWSFTAARIPSLAPRLAAALDPFGQPAVPGRAQLGDCDLEQPVNSKRVATDLADHDKARQCLAGAGHDERATGRLSERIESTRQPHRCTHAAGDTAFGQRTGNATLRDVVGAPE